MSGSGNRADPEPDARRGRDGARTVEEGRTGDARRSRGSLTLRAGAATDTGRVRTNNEDAYVLEPPMFAVADGMGGEKAGELASGLAVDILSDQVRKWGSTSSLIEWVRRANSAVFNRAQRERAAAGMGTTLTAVLAEADQLRLAHVGDSRAYLLRGGQLSRLTADHTKVQDMADLGVITPEEARTHPQRNIITRALGIGPDLQIDEAVIPLEPRDRVLLCSDGLSGMIDEATILTILQAATDPQEAADSLVASANEAGGADNVTAVVIEVEASRPADQRVSRRGFRAWAPIGALARWFGGSSPPR